MKKVKLLYLCLAKIVNLENSAIDWLNIDNTLYL